MIHHDRDPVRELVEQARELRRREQPPPELFEAALTRLIREELGREQLARERSRRFSLSRALHVIPRSLLRLGPARLGLALHPRALALAAALALAVIVSWGARRQDALEPHQDVPTVALAAEPTPMHDATPARNLGDHVEQPSSEQRLALSAAPSSAPQPPLSEPPRRAEPSSGGRRLHFGGSPLERGIDPFYPGAPPASILWLNGAGAARIEGSGDKRKVAGFWTVESWTRELDSGTKKPSRPAAMRQMPDRRQCVDVSWNERLVLGWRSRGEPGHPGFELLQGQQYRLILPHVSVTGPVHLELIVIVGSSDDSHGPALVTHVMSNPTPSTLGFTFEPNHDDDRAAVSLFVDAVGPSGASKLCVGAVRLDPQQTEADARAEPASAVAADKTSTDKTAGAKKGGKKKPAPPDGSTEKPTDKRALPTSCDPPWYIDAKGIKHLKPNCL
jgi:hypothetical protein